MDTGNEETPHFAEQLAAYGYISAAAVMAHTAVASQNITTDSAIFVDRSETDQVRQLEKADQLARGDRVITILRWHKLDGNGDNSDFTITNPLPRSISYQQSSYTNEEVSINSRKTWGKLKNMRVGSRIATPEDVTHIRWRISPQLSSRGKGQIAYSGIVR